MNNAKVVKEINTKEQLKNMEDVSKKLEVMPTTIDPMRASLDKLSSAQIMALYELSVRTKNDKNFNPIPEIPEEIFKIIQEDGKALGLNSSGIAILAREMVMSFGEEIMLDKELKELNKEIDHAKALPEFMDLYGEALRDTYEVKIGEEAEKETDPERKAALLAVRDAFIDSYTLAPLLPIISCKEEGSRNRLIKTMYKKVNRLCDDFDFTLNKVIAKKTSIRSIINALHTIYPENEVWRDELFIACLTLACHNATTDDKGMMMYMYASIFNINTLAINKSKEIEEDIEFTKIRKEKLDHFFEVTRTVFPDREFPEYVPMATKKKNKKAREHQCKS